MVEGNTVIAIKPGTTYCHVAIANVESNSDSRSPHKYEWSCGVERSYVVKGVDGMVTCEPAGITKKCSEKSKCV